MSSSSSSSLASAAPSADEPLASRPNEPLVEEGAEDDVEESINNHDENEQEYEEHIITQDGRSLVYDLHSHLNDGDISDVELVGTDGKSVLAVRSILAMRSRFFKTLFFGHFRESCQESVPLGYSSLVLKAVVEYCYTDEIKTTFENLSFEETARSMVGLVAAGGYFELGGLLGKAYRLTCLMMDEYPALSCAVLDEASYESELSRVALGIIRLRTESALLPPDTYGLGVRSLGKEAMERVMSDSEIQTSELALFECLQKWAEYVPPLGDDDEAEENRERRLQERRATARELAAHIDFAKIEPSSLSTIVADSGFVPEHLLLKAYRTQALQAECKGLSFTQNRGKHSSIGGRILVQGAGLAAVNGTYTSSSTCSTGMLSMHDPLCYSRPGSLPGMGRGKFILQTWILQDDTKKWFLSFVCKETTLDLYSAPVLSELDPPPMQKWLSVTLGHSKLLQMDSSSRPKQRHTSFEHSCHHFNDNGAVGDPPPICIWLPNTDASSCES